MSDTSLFDYYRQLFMILSFQNIVCKMKELENVQKLFRPTETLERSAKTSDQCLFFTKFRLKMKSKLGGLEYSK